MKKATHDMDRSEVSDFEQIINIGPKIATQFREIGLKSPQELIGNDPVELYKATTKKRGVFLDPCALDCHIAAVDFMNGSPPKTWWQYTEERKKSHSDVVDSLRWSAIIKPPRSHVRSLRKNPQGAPRFALPVQKQKELPGLLPAFSPK